MATESPFTVCPREAGQIVKNIMGANRDDNRHCYLMHVSLRPVYGEGYVPHSAFKKLPRLINGIPLGAGRIWAHDSQEIRWRYIEGPAGPLHSFLSTPMSHEEAYESKIAFRDRLLQQSQAVFGEVTVKATIILSQCLSYDSDFFINDIADSIDTGLHFKD
jgi:hypothetical protein